MSPNATPAGRCRRSPLARRSSPPFRAANVVALFGEQPREVEAYDAAATALQRLQRACSDESGAERLRRLCFDDDDGIPPAGEGIDRDEAEEAEESIVVGGLAL